MGIEIQVEGDGIPSRAYAFDHSAIIGRDPDQATLVLEDPYVSRLHGVVQRRKDGCWVYIHRGRNPSRLDGEEMCSPGQQALLHDGSILKVGALVIRLCLDEEPQTELVVVAVADSEPEVEDYSANPELDETCMDQEIPDLAALEAGHLPGGGAPEDGASLEAPVPAPASGQLTLDQALPRREERGLPELGLGGLVLERPPAAETLPLALGDVRHALEQLEPLSLEEDLRADPVSGSSAAASPLTVDRLRIRASEPPRGLWARLRHWLQRSWNRGRGRNVG